MNLQKRTEGQRASLIAQIIAQQKWIAEHGSSLVGYIARYGSYGNGGEAIYRADVDALLKLESSLWVINNRRRRK